MREIKPIPLKKLAKGLSTMDRIRYGIVYLRISGNEVLEMKEILKTEARSIIAEVKEPKMSILKAMETYLDAYIDGLNKRETFKLYMAYLEIKDALDSAQAQYAKFEFLAKMYQTYTKEGWSVKPSGNLAKSIKKFKESETVKTIIGSRKSVPKKAVKKAVSKKKASARKAKPTASKAVKKKGRR
jgi:hypothetical protein